MVLDEDGPLRRVVPFLRPPPAPACGPRPAPRTARGQQSPPDVPSLGVAAFLAASKIGPDRVRVDHDASTLMLGNRELPLLRFPVPRLETETGAREARHALVRFRGPGVQQDGKTTYRIYPFADLLLSEDQIGEGEKPRVDPAVFKDTIVFVGLSAAGLHDTFMTPLGNTGKIPGTQIHATVTDQLLAGALDPSGRRAAADRRGLRLRVGRQRDDPAAADALRRAGRGTPGGRRSPRWGSRCSGADGGCR